MLCLTLDIISHNGHVHVNNPAMNECGEESTNDHTDFIRKFCTSSNPLSLLKQKNSGIYSSQPSSDVAATSLTIRSHLLPRFRSFGLLIGQWEMMSSRACVQDSVILAQSECAGNACRVVNAKLLKEILESINMEGKTSGIPTWEGISGFFLPVSNHPL